MIIEKLEVGPLAVNCYLVGDELSHEGMIIDPGAEAQNILERVQALNLTIGLIILTHAHFDHIGGLKEIKDATKAQIAVHAQDAPALGREDPVSASFGFSYPLPPPPDKLLADGDIIKLGSLDFLVLHSPGHTPGSICLLIGDVVFTGDTLFFAGIGRTDLAGGSSEKIMENIRTKLLVLPDDTVVYPGHGPQTTIGQERRNNPFL